MKISIKTKLLLSFTAVILIMAVISVSFISIFADTYLQQQATRQLKDYADRIVISVVGQQKKPSVESLRLVLSQIAEKDYSLALFNDNDEYQTGFRMDRLSISGENFVSAVKPKLSVQGPGLIKDGSSIYSIYTRSIRSSEDTDKKLCTIVLVMQTDTYGLDRALFAFFITSIFFSAIIAVASAAIFSRTLTTNLKKLQQKADMLAHRQFDSVVTVEANDEVGELARSIDLMAKSIQEYDNSQKLFLQNASHELKTPLMSIQGYVEGLKDGVFENRDQTYDTILAQTKRLEKIIEDVLYLSKIETTKEVLDERAVTAGDIVDEAIGRLSGIAASANIALVRGNMENISVYADTDRMATALSNILSNCLRFAKTEVMLSTFISDGQVCFVIRDDGPGISQEDIPHLFERFYKGRNGKHGLGLAIAKAVVEQHHGTITAYNRTDGQSGAVFEIKIPIAAQLAEE